MINTIFLRSVMQMTLVLQVSVMRFDPGQLYPFRQVRILSRTPPLQVLLHVDQLPQ